MATFISKHPLLPMPKKKTRRNIVSSFEYSEDSTFKTCSRVQTIHLSFEHHATVPQPILATGVAHVASPRTGKHRLKTTSALRCQDFWLFQSELNHLCIVHLQSPSAVPIGTLSDIRLIVTHACETGAHADGCFVSVWTVAEN